MAVLAGLMSLFALSGCDPTENEGDPFITINGETVQNLKAEKSSFTVNLSTNRDWSVRIADAAAEWLAVTPNSGKAAENGVDVTVSVLENTAGNRTAAIEFYTGTATATLTVNQEGPDGDSSSETIGKPEGNGTKESPYNVSAALTLIAGGKYSADDDVYVKGQISKITEVNTSFGNATYNIVDKDYADNALLVYRGYYLDGKKFTAKDQIKVGDEVVVLGKLTLFYENSEITQGNQLVSLNGKEAEVQPEVETKEATVSEIAAAVASGTEDGNYSVKNGQVMVVASKDKLIMNDGTGCIYVYKQEHGLTAGEIATFSGKGTKYYTSLEFEGSDIEKTGSAVCEYPEAEAWGATEIDAYFNSELATVKYATVSGTLVKNGDYYNLETEGTASADFISLYATVIDLSEFVNKAVKVTGYVYSLNSNKKYVEMAAVEMAIDAAADYVIVDPASLSWGADDLSAKTVTVNASGEFSVAADEASFTEGYVWATAAAEGNTITITPDPAVSTAGAAGKLEGKFIVTCGEKSATIDVTVKFGADCQYPFTSNVSWTLGANAYDQTFSGNNKQAAVVNGSDVTEMVKLGTSSKSGDVTITIPAGTKTLELYALSWKKNKDCKITVTGCGETPVEIDLKSNDGVSGNPPYTIATTDGEARYSISVTDATATSVTITSSARAIFWGINTYSE